MRVAGQSGTLDLEDLGDLNEGGLAGLYQFALGWQLVAHLSVTRREVGIDLVDDRFVHVLFCTGRYLSIANPVSW